MTGNSSEPPLASAAHEKHSLGSLEEDDEFEEFLAEGAPDLQPSLNPGNNQLFERRLDRTAADFCPEQSG